MSFKMISSLMLGATLMASAPAFAADCTGKEGKELKDCEKANAAQAKQDARSVPFTPSALAPELSAWDAADKNPFATEMYRVRVTPTEIASVDEYLMKAFKIQATVVFSKYVIDEAGKGNMDVIKVIPKMLPILQAVATDGQALATEGQDLITNKVPAEIKADPKLAMKGPKALSALKDAITALQSSVTSAPEVAKSVAALAP